MSLSRFKGTLVGAVVADCMGSIFEGMTVLSLKDVISNSAEKLETYRQKQREDGTRPADTYGFSFTDDTAMARSVAASLLKTKDFDAQDMAQRFASEYKKEPWRGYGGNVIEVFEKLQDPDLKDVYGPATAQFDGSGSYGNGGAMRVAPVPLFTFATNKDSELQNIVTLTTRLTHTHHLAVNGTILQALAVDQSLRLDSEEDLKASDFLDSLIEKMKEVEKSSDDSPTPAKQSKPKRELDGHPTPYTTKLEKIKEYLERESLDTSEIVEVLGHDVSAVGSVPTAVLAFLRAATQNIPELEPRNKFEKTVLYAISLGGDTDTIATMAAAMAGALYGMDQIPEAWQYYCEGVADAETMAEELFRLSA